MFYSEPYSGQGRISILYDRLAMVEMLVLNL